MSNSKSFSLIVVAETVVGATTGCVPAPKGYFKAMKSVCDKYGALFILDEVSQSSCIIIPFGLLKFFRLCLEWAVSMSHRIRSAFQLRIFNQVWERFMHGNHSVTELRCVYFVNDMLTHEGLRLGTARYPSCCEGTRWWVRQIPIVIRSCCLLFGKHVAMPPLARF